jgi:hypothetical protein
LILSLDQLNSLILYLNRTNLNSIAAKQTSRSLPEFDAATAGDYRLFGLAAELDYELVEPYEAGDERHIRLALHDSLDWRVLDA